MQLTEEQAIKVGFLARCAEAGLTREETHSLIKQAILQLQNKQNIASLTKEAFTPQLINAVSSVGKGLMGLGSSAISAVAPLATAVPVAAVAAPIAGGVGAGYLAAKLTHGDAKDALEDAKQDELVGEYERLADEAKRRTILKRIQQQTGKSVVPLSPSFGV